MNADEFENLFEIITQNMQNVLINKAKEYATDEDRLHNFKVAAQVIGGTPEEACWAFMTKHLVSIRDMVLSNKEYSPEVWDEKVGDALNYLVLLRALVAE